MEVKTKTDSNWTTTETIILSDEEKEAINEAHEIVVQRYKDMGLIQQPWEKDHLEYRFLGILRYEEIEAMLNFARTARMK